jgi:Gpi18-like mannosyltransferase
MSPTVSRRTATSLLRPLGVYAASRVVVLTTFAVAAHRHGYSLVTALGRWDGEWYRWVARYGYFSQPHGAPKVNVRAFFPLYPALVRGVSDVTGLSISVSAVVVSGLAGAAAACLLWLLALRTTDGPTALRAVALFAFFPGTFALSMAYAEPLFLVFAIACLLLVLRQRWVAAGVVAFLAGATRPDGVVLVIVTGYVAVKAVRARGGWRPLITPVLGAAGTIAFLCYLWARTGHPLEWFTVERTNWHNYFDAGSAQTIRVLGLVRHALHPLYDPQYLVTTLALVFVVGALIFLARSQLPVVLKLYAVISVLLSFTSHQVGTRPRAVLLAFPLFIAAAIGLRGRWFVLAMAVSAALLVVLSAVTAAPGTLTP